MFRVVTPVCEENGVRRDGVSCDEPAQRSPLVERAGIVTGYEDAGAHVDDRGQCKFRGGSLSLHGPVAKGGHLRGQADLRRVHSVYSAQRWRWVQDAAGPGEHVSGEVFVHPLEGALRQPLQRFGDGRGVHVCDRNVSAAEQRYVSLSLPHRVSAPPFRSYDRKQTQRVNGAVPFDPRGILGGKRIKERTYHT